MTAPSQLMIARLHEVKRSRDIEDALDYLLEAVSLLKSSESRLAEAERENRALRANTSASVLRRLTEQGALAPGEPEVCPICGSDHSGQFCPHNPPRPWPQAAVWILNEREIAETEVPPT